MPASASPAQPHSPLTVPRGRLVGQHAAYVNCPMDTACVWLCLLMFQLLPNFHPSNKASWRNGSAYDSRSEYNPRGAAGYNVRADVAAQHSGVDFWQIESTCHNQHSRQGGNWEPGRPTAAAAMVSIPEGSVPAGLADTSWSIDSDAPQLPGEADLAVKLRWTLPRILILEWRHSGALIVLHLSYYSCRKFPESLHLHLPHRLGIEEDMFIVDINMPPKHDRVDLLAPKPSELDDEEIRLLHQPLPLDIPTLRKNLLV
ncbi:hypothetical protein OOU_Y34scaffold00091g6 [Pyricularia oryzae Y34]|nr:hypothetical protein OOU_Y34scaffold00091g6 [Pyricularia oryzae Y34]